MLQRRGLATFLAVLLVAFGVFAPDADANGILVSERGRTATGSGPLSLVEHRVKAQVTGSVAEVTVEQVFHNASSRQLEGAYLFPLPAGAVVSRFSMTMGEQMVAGEVVEADQARRIYEGIVRQRRDPGLLEYVGRDLYRAKVFPIEPRSDLTIRLTFQQVLPEDMGTLELVYPLATHRFHGSPVQKVVVDVAVESGEDLKAIYSASHKVDVVRDGERKARITYESAGQAQTRDFRLFLARSPEDVGFSAISHRRVGEDGTFMAVLAPRNGLADERRVPKDVVFVLDVSGSMRGKKMEQAKRSLAYGIRTLADGDRFNVVSFSTTVRPFRDGFVEATREIQEAAVEWVDTLEAQGGTNIHGALLQSLGMRTEERLFLLVFLTDGEPTVGPREPDEIVAAVKAANPGNARIFTFGIDENLNVALLDKIAEATRGARDYVGPDEDIEIVTGRFFRKINAPVMSDLQVDLGEGVYDLFPPTLGDLFAGEQIVLFGRYKAGGPRTITLKGKVGQQELEYQVAAVFREGEGAGFLPRLWAHRKVAFLLDEIRLHGHDPELEHEIVRLATRHAIVTPYTAGLVVEEMREFDARGRPVAGTAGMRDHVETDNDLPFEEGIGNRGISDAPFTGPANNGLIGLGGGAGGAFGGRGGSRDLGGGGGGRRSQGAVESALKWFKDHQSPNGSWDADGFDLWCSSKPQQALSDAGHAATLGDVGATGYALQAMLGAGYSNRGRHPFAKVVSKGLRYLKNVQDAEGRFGSSNSPGFLFEHAAATLAMVEAYGMTGSPIFKGSAQKALDALVAMRSDGGGWGRAPRAATADVRHTVFGILPVVSAGLINEDAVRRGRQAPLVVDPEVARQTLAFLESQTVADTGLVIGSPSDTAFALWGRILLGQDPRREEALKKAAEALAAHPPVAGGPDADPLAWYVGTSALFNVGGLPWKTWNGALKSAVVDTARRDGTYCEFKGSWNPFGETGRMGGRVLTTALLSLSQEVYYRYDKVFGVRGPSAPQAPAAQPSVGQQVRDSERLRNMKGGMPAERPAEDDGLEVVRKRIARIGDRTFLLRQGGRWVDTAWDEEGEPKTVEAFSDGYFELLGKGPEVARILAVGAHVVFVLDGQAYEVTPAAEPEPEPEPEQPAQPQPAQPQPAGGDE